MQLPPVGLANISGSTGGRENGPQAMVQETSASTTLPHQSRAGAFPNLGAKHNRAHVKRYRPAALPQARDISIAPLSEMLLKRKRLHLKEDCSRDIGSAFLTLFRSQFLPQVSLKKSFVPCCPQALRRVTAMRRDDLHKPGQGTALPAVA